MAGEYSTDGRNAKFKFQKVQNQDLIKVPENAQYFAALGAVEFGRSEEDCVGCYCGYEKLIHYIDYGRRRGEGEIRR